MRFTTANGSENVTSREQLLRLIDSALRAKTKFQLGEGGNRYLQLAVYSEDGSFIELHRGKKWTAWISPPVTANEEICRLFVEYYEQGDLSDELLSRDPEWLEASGFHPAVYVIVAVVMVAGLIFISLNR